jgi:hypothetical protein
MNVISAANGSDRVRWPRKADNTKALFMVEVVCMVRDGRATLTALECGTIELRFTIGQI